MGKITYQETEYTLQQKILQAKKERNKSFLTISILFLFLFLTIYIVFAFYNLDINFTNWEEDNRRPGAKILGGLSLVYFIFIGVILMLDSDGISTYKTKLINLERTPINQEQKKDKNISNLVFKLGHLISLEDDKYPLNNQVYQKISAIIKYAAKESKDPFIFTPNDIFEKKKEEYIRKICSDEFIKRIKDLNLIMLLDLVRKMKSKKKDNVFDESIFDAKYM